MAAAVEIRELRVVFPGKRQPVVARDGIDLTVEAGRVFGFLGPNGAGKTTTMHVLLGFIAPTSGEARLLGEDVRRHIARQRIGYLPEHPDTYRFLTGRELLYRTVPFAPFLGVVAYGLLLVALLLVLASLAYRHKSFTRGALSD
jgi:ABC-type multidrug transport system ATPase subunit